MTALVAVVALAGCTKNENVAVEDTTVFVKISNELETKAIGDPIGSSTPIVFTDGFLFFTDGGGVITKRYTIAPSGGDMSVTQLQSGYQITGVPSSSTQVFVVGTIPSGISVPAAGNISAVQALAISVQSQADASSTKVNRATLYGAGTVSGATASLSVKPIAARVEVGSITGGGTVSAYKVTGIFINNYYPDSKLSGLVNGALVNNANDAAKYVGNGAQYTTALAPIYDYNASGLPSMSGLVCSPGAGKVWNYNVMAPTDAAAAPRVIIRLSDVVLGTGASAYTFPSDQFLTVKLGTLTSLAAGKAYNLGNIAFTESNLGSTPETATVSVTVTITTVAWTTESVSPVL